MQEEPRWTTPVGLAIVGLVVLANAVGGIGLGTSGDALVVTVSVAVYCVCAVVFLLWFDAPPAVTVALLLLMGASATATHHGDPTGTGGIGLYLGVAFAPLRLPVRTAAVVSAVVVLAFDVQLALEATNPYVFILVVDGGAAFFFLLGTLLRREREQRLEVARLVTELEASREAEKTAAALAERSRLAREMHDVLAHTLSGLALQVQGARSLARTVVPADSDGEELVAVLDRAHTLARDGLAEARQAIGALRGAQLPGPELLPVLVEEHRHAHGGECCLRVAGTPAPLPPDGRLALYRTAQEALSNVRKHAPGAQVDVRLDWQAQEVCLLVENAAAPSDRAPDAGMSRSGAGYGLTGMAERARLLGGELAAGPTATGFPRRAPAAPAARRISSPAGAAEIRSTGGGGDVSVRVLVVDDQRIVREGLSLLLRTTPDVELVGAAENGRQALDLVAELAPDVVLMDLRMPELDGVEATRAIRAAHPGVHVIVLTTYSDDESVFAALRAGARGYLTKDADADELARAIQRVHAGMAMLDSDVQARLLDRLAAPASPASDAGGSASGTADRPAAAGAAGRGSTSAAAGPLPDDLTSREVEVLALIAQGLSNAEIARHLFLSEATVKTHINRLFAKTAVRDRAQAVRYAYQHGLAAP